MPRKSSVTTTAGVDHHTNDSKIDLSIDKPTRSTSRSRSKAISSLDNESKLTPTKPKIKRSNSRSRGLISPQKQSNIEQSAVSPAESPKSRSRSASRSRSSKSEQSPSKPRRKSKKDDDIQRNQSDSDIDNTHIVQQPIKRRNSRKIDTPLSPSPIKQQTLTKDTMPNKASKTSTKVQSHTSQSLNTSNDDNITHDKPSSSPSSPDDDFSSNIILLSIIFIISAFILGYIVYNFPQLDLTDRQYIKIPRSIDDVKHLSYIVDKYKDKYWNYVILSFSAAYIFLQSFAIPGPVFLSILAGPIFGVFPAVLIISCVATTGSSLCYLLSKTLAGPLIVRYFPERITQFRQHIYNNRDNLFFYLLFLRIAPVLPNWLISVASPILKVPFLHFFMATFIGIMPNNYIMATVGSTLHKITEPGPLITPQSLLSLTGIGLVALIPVLAQRFMKQNNNSIKAQ